MTSNETDAYLRRIGYEGPRERTYLVLAALQKAHMHSIPFENFDVFVGRPLDLTEAALYRKMIVGRRGGYCFELNTLYASLLQSLGFAPRPVLGRVRLRNPEAVPPRNHLAYLVETEPGVTYLTDVGFGGLTTRVPLNIDRHEPIDDGEGLIRVTPSQPGEYLIERGTEEGWQPQYSFELLPVQPSDIQSSNHFTETHDSSHFRHSRFVGLFTDTGRIGLYENQFSERVGPEVVLREEVADGPAWESCLRSRFGLVLDYPDAELSSLAKSP